MSNVYLNHPKYLLTYKYAMYASKSMHIIPAPNSLKQLAPVYRCNNNVCAKIPDHLSFLVWKKTSACLPKPHDMHGVFRQKVGRHWRPFLFGGPFFARAKFQKTNES